MNGEIIYEKKYTNEYLSAITTPTGDAQTSADHNQQSFAEFYKELSEPLTLTPVPQRKGLDMQFIQLAIEVSQLYHLDTVIKRHESHISVDYSFDGGGCMKYMLPVFRLADECSFFSGSFGRDITVSLEYYTHYVSRNGKIMLP